MMLSSADSVASRKWPIGGSLSLFGAQQSPFLDCSKDSYHSHHRPGIACEPDTTVYTADIWIVVACVVDYVLPEAATSASVWNGDVCDECFSVELALMDGFFEIGEIVACDGVVSEERRDHVDEVWGGESRWEMALWGFVFGVLAGKRDVVWMRWFVWRVAAW
jgi:hypothetical protein